VNRASSRLTAAIAAWRTFWFEEATPYAPALLRFALGGLGVISVVTLTPVDTFWSTQGLTPPPGGGIGIRELVAESGFDGVVAWSLFTACLAAFTSTLLGYRTSTAVVAAFVAAVGMTYWNRLPLNGGHYVSAGLLIWAFPLFARRGGRGADRLTAIRTGELDQSRGVRGRPRS
jgi:hypothetical protein